MRIGFFVFIMSSFFMLSGCNKTELTQEFFKDDYSVTQFKQFFNVRYVSLKNSDTGKEHSLLYTNLNCDKETLPKQGYHYNISGIRYYSLSGDFRESIQNAERLFCQKNHG